MSYLQPPYCCRWLALPEESGLPRMALAFRLGRQVRTRLLHSQLGRRRTECEAARRGIDSHPLNALSPEPLQQAQAAQQLALQRQQQQQWQRARALVPLFASALRAAMPLAAYACALHAAALPSCQRRRSSPRGYAALAHAATRLRELHRRWHEGCDYRCAMSCCCVSHRGPQPPRHQLLLAQGCVRRRVRPCDQQC